MSTSSLSAETEKNYADTVPDVDWEHRTSSRPGQHNIAAIAFAAELRRLVHSASISMSAMHILDGPDYARAAMFMVCANHQVATPTRSVSALQRLRTFSGWAANWDAEGAPAPDQEAIEAAANMLGHLRSFPIEPIATLDALGRPMFLLHYTGGEGEISFTSGDTFEFVIDVPGDDSEVETELHFDKSGLPEKLEAVLSKLRATFTK